MPGERVFSVSLQGKPVAEDLDIVKEAGGAMRGLEKVFTGIEAGSSLEIAFKAKVGEPLICGVQVVAEK